MKRSTGVSLIVLALLGVLITTAPVQILSASSGSMEPAIDKGDIYFVTKSDSISKGDIITFDSEEFNEFVTHRVVGRTSSGYITKGDANPSTDQAAGHPPVSDSKVIGTVIEIGGHPVSIPGLGSVIGYLQSNVAIVAIGLLAYLVVPELWTSDKNRRKKKRDVFYAGSYMHPLFLIAFVSCIGLIFVGSSAHEVTYVAAEGQATAAHTVPVGETATRTLSLETYSAPMVTTVVDAKGFAILDRQTTGSEISLSIAVPPRKTTGPIHGVIEINSYPATLPKSVLSLLDDIHWILAALGSMVPIFGPTFTLYFLYVHPEAPIRKTRIRWLRSLRGV